MNASMTYRQAIGRRASMARWAPDASHAELDAAIWVMKAERALRRLNKDAPTITAAQRDRLQALLTAELAGHCEDTSPRRLNLTAAVGPTGFDPADFPEEGIGRA